jgi:V/A-type H+-transporting ATPase subunit I
VILDMRKVLFVGPDSERDSFLKKMQKAGILQIETYTGSQFAAAENIVDETVTDRIAHSWKILKAYRDQSEVQLHHEKKATDVEIGTIVSEVLECDRQLSQLREEEKDINQKVELLEPLGDFDIEVIRKVENISSTVIQFWETTEKNYPTLEFPEKSHVITVKTEKTKVYFITIGRKRISPDRASEIVMDESLKDLLYSLVRIQREATEIENRLVDYSIYMEDIYFYYLSELNELNYKKALGAMVNPMDGMLFALQGWTARESLNTLHELALDCGVQLLEIEPDKGEKVPTNLKNSGLAEMGQDLVMFYDTPSSREWDPSTWVFLSFIVFFAMIMGDGGYGLTLFALLLGMRLKFRKAKRSTLRFMNMGMVLTFATFVYGALFDNIFGVNLLISHQIPFPGFIQPAVDWINSFKAMEGAARNSALMRVSILIGLGHISLSLVLKTLRDFTNKKFISPLSNIAWIIIMWTFYFWYSAGGDTSGMFQTRYGMIMAGGLAVVFLTSSGSLNPLKIVGGGLLGVYNGVQFFSDVLSYIRIFALGLSGSLIAIVFNDLAMGVMGMNAPAPIAVVLGVLILVFGHLLNIGLCLMGAVIHGLRLNFLEYYRWSFDGDGRPFKPFEDLLLRGGVIKS